MNFINKKIKKIQEEGFTIIETLVAITILMIVVVGPLTIAQRGLLASIYARDQVMASYLAQDAMEYIKNSRDNTVGGGSSTFITWMYGIDGRDDKIGGLSGKCRSEELACVVDTYKIGYVYRPSVTSYYDLYVSDTSHYIPNPQSSITPSPSSAIASIYKSIFRRKFYVDTTSISNPGREATLVVIVSWSNGTVENEVRLVNQIFDITL